MSLTPSRRASNTIRSAISQPRAIIAVLALAAACSTPLPTANIVAAAKGHVGVAVALDGSGSASSAPKAKPPHTLVFEWSFWSIPAQSKAKLNDASLAKPGFVPDVPGDYVVQLVVVDDQAVSAATQATITVADDCRPTVSAVTALPSQPAVGQAVGLSATTAPACSDVNGGGATVAYRWWLVQAPAGSRAAIDEPATAQPSFMPDVRGDYEVAVAITDQAGLTSDGQSPTAHLKITAASCGDNLPVVQEVGAIPARPNVNQEVQLSALVADADTQSPCSLTRAFTYSWSILSLPAGSAARLNSTTATNPAFRPDVPGDYLVGLVVSDDLGRPSARQTFTVSTLTCGSAIPDATAVAPMSASVGQPVQLGVQVKDTDNPATNGLNPIGSGSPAPADGGTSDAGNSGSADAGVTDAGPADAGATDAGTSDAGVADAGSPGTGPICAIPLSFSYRWRLVSAPTASRVTFNNPALAAASFTPDVPGDYVVEVVVFASTGYASAPARTTVSVSTCGSLPPLAVVVAPAGAVTGLPVSLTSTVTDPNSVCATETPYSYTWTLQQAPPGSAATLSGTAVSGRSAEVAPSFTPDLQGTYVVGLVVSDRSGLTSALATATITVAPCNAPLTVALTAPAGAATGSPVALSATVIDPNAPPSMAPTSGVACSLTVLPYSYVWMLVGQPTGSHAKLNNPTATAPSFVPDVPGTYTVQLGAMDAVGNRSAPTAADIVVANCTAPLTTTIAPVVGASAGVPVSLSAAVADPNDPAAGACLTPVLPLSYTWTLVGLPTGSRARLNNAAAASPSFVPDVEGTYAVALAVNDAAGNGGPVATATITVSATCLAPPVAAITALDGAITGLPVTMATTVTDPNAGCGTTAPYAYSWRLTQVPPGSTATLSGLTSLGTSAQVAPSFVPDVAGTYELSVMVVDQLGLSSLPVTFTVAVSNCTAPLTVTSISAPGGVPTGLPVSLSANVTDPNTPSTNPEAGPVVCKVAVAPYSYNWSLVGQPSNSHAGLNSSTASAPSFVPDVAGTYTVSVVVVDAAGNRSPATTSTITASDCAAPLTAGIDAAGGIAVGLPLAMTATVGDPNDPATNVSCSAAVAPLSYAWTLIGLPSNSHAALNNAAVASPSFTPDVAGTYALSLQVSDAIGNRSAPVTTNVVVSATCTAPLTASINAPAGSSTNVPVQLSATVGDPNDPANGLCSAVTAPFGYFWSLVGLPSGSRAQLNAPNAASPSFTPDLPGNYVVALAVGDQARNRSPVVTTNIVVASCSAPLTVSIQSTGTATLSPVTLRTTLGEPNVGQACGATAPLSYQWTLLARPPRSSAVLSNPLAVQPTFTPDVAGSYAVYVRATDALGNSGSSSTTLQISGCGTAPATTVVASPTTPELGQSVALTAPVADMTSGLCGGAAVAPFSYGWTLTAPIGSAAVLNNSNSAHPSFTPDVMGSYSYSVVVTDALGYQTSTTGSVNASNCPITPVIMAPGAAVPTYSTVPLAASFTVPAGCAAPPVTYAWSFDQEPAGSSALFNNPNQLTPSFVADVPSSSWVVRLTVTDQQTMAQTFRTATVTTNACGGVKPVAMIGMLLPSMVAAQSNATPPTTSATTVTALTNIQLDGTASASSTCGGALSYNWITWQIPPGSRALLQPSNGGRPVVQLDVRGDYIFELLVNDSRFQSAPAYFRITAN
jgi:PKD repeat protein